MTYTPLTLEFTPELPEDDNQSQPVVICEPSLQYDGRIFCAVHPFGTHVPRVGIHMLPDDVRRLRDHLSKLLMEPEPEDGTPVDWQKRIQAAAARAEKQKKRRQKRGPFFRLEFQFGSLQGVLGRLRD